MKAIKFTNITKEDFSHTWDGDQYDFKAGETIMLPDHLAKHFAKHLANRHFNGEKAPKNGDHIAFANKCLASTEIEANTEDKLNATMAQTPSEKKTSITSKESTNAVDVPVKAKEAPEEDFEGLEEEPKEEVKKEKAKESKPKTNPKK